MGLFGGRACPYLLSCAAGWRSMPKEIRMPLPDELERLNVLHERGALTDEEFAIAKKRLLEGAPEGAGWSANPEREPASTLSRLYRSPTNRWFGGVCSGLGELTGIPAWSWRILFVLTAFLHGLGLLMYILLWIFVPIQVTTPKPITTAKE
jgi:phage shock protein C